MAYLRGGGDQSKPGSITHQGERVTYQKKVKVSKINSSTIASP